MRLTKKSDKLGYCLRHSSISANKCWDKLGQLEDIEEEINFDLITLFKALKNGVCYKNRQGQIKKDLPHLNYNKPTHRWYLEIGWADRWIADKENGWWYPLEFKDYGKTWALTEEELL